VRSFQTLLYDTNYVDEIVHQPTKGTTTMSNTKKVAPTLESSITETLGSLQTTAAKVRFLDSEGYDKGDISRILNIRYQWVRNVLLTPLKK
jgi:hypothetical protein